MNNRALSFFSLKTIAYETLRKLVVESIHTCKTIPNHLFTVSTGVMVGGDRYAMAHAVTNARDKVESVLLDVLLHAVVDEDRSTVNVILSEYPELLLVKAQKGTEIESQYTWLKIDAEHEDALSIAVKRKQIDMVGLLLSFYKNLSQTDVVLDAKRESLLAWRGYTNRNVNRQEGLVIPREYAIYAQSLIAVFTDEASVHGADNELNNSKELALSFLFETLFPRKAVKLDNYIDPELLLLALYKAYRNHFSSFRNWEQRDAFCVRVIGLVQSALIPETAKIFCGGLYHAAAGEVGLGLYRDPLRLFNGDFYYRQSRDARCGLGFEYMCYADRVASGHGFFMDKKNIIAMGVNAGSIGPGFEQIILDKDKNFSKCYSMAPRLAR